jgi:peptidoglycan/LPS O-acetylase OafA/YrhL
LFLCLIILPQFKPGNLDISYFTSNQLWLWLYGQNWLYIFKEPYGSKLLLHLWSLAVEEQFYLIWPLIILLIRKPKILLCIAILLLIVTNGVRFILWYNQIQNLDYFHLYTFTRIDGICIGCMVAVIIKIDPSLLRKYTLPIILSFALINFIFYFVNKHTSSSLLYLALMGYTTFALLFGYLVYEAALGKSIIIEVLFNNRFIKFFGKISYGLYMFHWPIFLLLFPVFQKLLITHLNFRGNIADKLSSVIVTLIAVFISCLSYYYFESYFLKLKNHFSKPKNQVTIIER